MSIVLCPWGPRTTCRTKVAPGTGRCHAGSLVLLLQWFMERLLHRAPLGQWDLFPKGSQEMTIVIHSQTSPNPGVHEWNSLCPWGHGLRWVPLVRASCHIQVTSSCLEVPYGSGDQRRCTTTPALSQGQERPTQLTELCFLLDHSSGSLKLVVISNPSLQGNSPALVQGAEEEFLPAGFDPAPPWLRQPFGEWTGGWMTLFFCSASK